MPEIEELHIEPGQGPHVIRNDDHSGHDARRYLRHRVRRMIRDAILIIVAIILSAIIAISAYFAISAVIVANEVKSSVASVSALRGLSTDDLASGDLATKLQASSGDLKKHADAAYAHTSNPVWAVAGGLPRYGADIEAVRTAVDVLHQVSDDALPLIADAADDVNISHISLSNGSISIPGIRDAAPKLAKANEAIAAANQELQAIGGVTIGALNQQLTTAKGQFITVAKASDAIARGAQLLPSMLGLDNPDGARNYLVLAQNNAEVRATGGIPGSFGLVTVKNGTVEMHDFLSTSDFGSFSQPVVPLNADEQSLFGERLGEFMQDVNFTPDFARTGQLAKAMWEARQGGTVDGVISMDPVFLQRVLAAVGSVEVSKDGVSVTLDGSNTAETLLSKVYALLPDNADQDEFFGVAAKAAFNKILHSSSANPSELAKQVISATQDGHLYVWSANADEQKLLDGTMVGGTLVTEESGGYLGGKAPQQVIGVYYNDAMASKMDWYLERSVEDRIVETYPNGREQHSITIRLRNVLTASDVSKLPDYVIGSLENGAVKGNIQFINYLYVPAGGSAPEYAAGPNAEKGDSYVVHDGLTAIAKQVSLAPGESYEITATIYTASGSLPGHTVVRQTPLAR